MNKRIRKKKITEKLRGRELSSIWFYTEAVWRYTGARLKCDNCTQHRKYHIVDSTRKMYLLHHLYYQMAYQFHLYYVLSMKHLIKSDEEAHEYSKLKTITEVILPPVWITNRNKFRQYIKSIDPEIVNHITDNYCPKSSIINQTYFPLGKEYENPRDII